MPSAGSLAFAAAVRMVHRVHGHAAVHRAASLPARAAGLAHGHVLMVHVADLADGRHAFHQHFAGLAGRQLNQRIVAFLGHQLRRTSSGTHHLRALTRTQLDVVDGGAGWNMFQGQRIAYQDVGFRAAHDLAPHLQTHGMNDVTLLAIRISNQRDARRPVGIIFNGNHCAGNARFVSLEINGAQFALMAAAAMPDSDIAPIAPAAGAPLDLGQGLVRPVGGQLLVGQRGLKPQRRRSGSVCFDSHVKPASSC